MELVSFKAEPRLILILDQLVSKGIFISRSAIIRFALWNKLSFDYELEHGFSDDPYSEPIIEDSVHFLKDLLPEQAKKQ